MQDQSRRGYICLRRTHIGKKAQSKKQKGQSLWTSIKDNLKEMDCVMIQQESRQEQRRDRQRCDEGGSGQMERLGNKTGRRKQQLVAIES